MSEITDLKKAFPNTVSATQMPERIPDTELGLGSFKTINIGSGSQSLRGDRDGLWLGAEKFADAPFSVNMAGDLIATSATISGSITSTSGTIAGWTIGATTLSKNNATLSSAGELTLGTGNDIVKASSIDATYRLWIGHATAASAPFSVTKAGVTKMTSASVLGDVTVGVGGKIVTNDGTRNRVEVGNYTGTTYGIKVVDAAGVILLDETKIKSQYTFSTFMESPNANFTAVVGWVHYDATAGVDRNACVRLDFVKPTNFTITGAVVYYRMQDYIDPTGSTRLKDVNIYLNPTKTLVTAGTFDYYRYSTGTGQLVATNIDPNADEFTGSETFTAGEIAAIGDGSNYLLLQQSFNDTASGFLGYATMTLVLTGYLS